MSYFGVSPVVSALNATTTPLAGGATFTGTWELAPRSMLMIQSFSDAAGTAYFDFSTDGVNADSTFPVSGFSATASVPLEQPAAVGGRYFRVRYINGAGAQSAFRLSVFFSEISNFYSPLNQSYGLQSPAILTRSSLPWLDVARGLNTAITTIKKFGRNAAVGTSFVPVCLGGVYNTPQSGSATALRIKAGGNANDTAAGTGAREITIDGLDENFAVASETLATAGASASSATTTTFTRVNRAYVSASGTYATASAGSHAGNIVVENGAGGTDWFTIDAVDFPKSQSEISAYSVASGKTAYVFLDDITNESGKILDAIFFQRANIDETAAPYTAMRAVVVLSGVTTGVVDLSGRNTPLGPFVGPCDIGWLAKIDAGTAEVSAEFEIYEVTE